MFGMGMPEILLILAIALIVIGPKKLPDLAKSLGRALGEFKKAAEDLKDSVTDQAGIDDIKTTFKDINTNLDDIKDFSRPKKDVLGTVSGEKEEQSSVPHEKEASSPAEGKTPLDSSEPDNHSPHKSEPAVKGSTQNE